MPCVSESGLWVQDPTCFPFAYTAKVAPLHVMAT
jgi:hypothetical protein